MLPHINSSSIHTQIKSQSTIFFGYLVYLSKYFLVISFIFFSIVNCSDKYHYKDPIKGIPVEIANDIPDHKQSSMGLSGTLDIGSNNLLSFGKSMAFNISGHIGFTWYYRNSKISHVYPKATEEKDKVYHSDYMKSDMSYIYALIQPNISFLNNRMSLGLVLGLKHISHSMINNVKINTLAFVVGVQFRVMITKWLGITASYQYDLGFKNFVNNGNGNNDKYKWLKDTKYSNHNVITIGVSFIPYNGNKLYAGFTISPFTYNMKKISMDKINKSGNSDNKANAIGCITNENNEKYLSLQVFHNILQQYIS